MAEKDDLTDEEKKKKEKAGTVFPHTDVGTTPSATSGATPTTVTPSATPTIEVTLTTDEYKKAVDSAVVNYDKEVAEQIAKINKELSKLDSAYVKKLKDTPYYKERYAYWVNFYAEKKQKAIDDSVKAALEEKKESLKPKEVKPEVAPKASEKPIEEELGDKDKAVIDSIAKGDATIEVAKRKLPVSSALLKSVIDINNNSFLETIGEMNNFALKSVDEATVFRALSSARDASIDDMRKNVSGGLEAYIGDDSKNNAVDFFAQQFILNIQSKFIPMMSEYLATRMQYALMKSKDGTATFNLGVPSIKRIMGLMAKKSSLVDNLSSVNGYYEKDFLVISTSILSMLSDRLKVVSDTKKGTVLDKKDYEKINKSLDLLKERYLTNDVNKKVYDDIMSLYQKVQKLEEERAVGNVTGGLVGRKKEINILKESIKDEMQKVYNEMAPLRVHFFGKSELDGEKYKKDTGIKSLPRHEMSELAKESNDGINQIFKYVIFDFVNELNLAIKEDRLSTFKYDEEKAMKKAMEVLDLLEFNHPSNPIVYTSDLMTYAFLNLKDLETEFIEKLQKTPDDATLREKVEKLEDLKGRFVSDEDGNPKFVGPTDTSTGKPRSLYEIINDLGKYEKEPPVDEESKKKYELLQAEAESRFIDYMGVLNDTSSKKVDKKFSCSLEEKEV